MIPKIIHYCWFGPGLMSELELKCIESWNKLLPDFKLKLWNETNFNVEFCEFTKEAYRLKKYAFVSDVARIYALNQEGGVYLDTDMLLLKRLPESFLKYDFFIGMESMNTLNAAVYGTVPDHYLLNRILSFYKITSFSNSPKLIPEVLNSIFPNFSKPVTQRIALGKGIILPSFVFYPLPFKLKYFHWKQFLNDDSLSVHLWVGSWMDNEKFSIYKKIKNRIKYLISKWYVPKSFLDYSKNSIH